MTTNFTCEGKDYHTRDMSMLTWLPQHCVYCYCTNSNLANLNFLFIRQIFRYTVLATTYLKTRMVNTILSNNYKPVLQWSVAERDPIGRSELHKLGEDEGHEIPLDKWRQSKVASIREIREEDMLMQKSNDIALGWLDDTVITPAHWSPTATHNHGA